MGGEEPEHAARLEKMPRYRLGIENLPLIIRATLHPSIVPKPVIKQSIATQVYSAVSQ